MEKRLTYNIQIERDEDGIYVVSVPALSGCFTQGRTLEEAMEMAQDAVSGFINMLIERGEDVPEEDNAKQGLFSISVVAPQLTI